MARPTGSLGAMGCGLLTRCGSPSAGKGGKKSGMWSGELQLAVRLRFRGGDDDLDIGEGGKGGVGGRRGDGDGSLSGTADWSAMTAMTISGPKVSTMETSTFAVSIDGKSTSTSSSLSSSSDGRDSGTGPHKRGMRSSSS